MLKKLFPIFVLTLLIIAACTKEEVVDDHTKQDSDTIQAYLTKHGITNVQQTSDGLYYIIKKAGGTAHPTSKNGVLVHYKGYFTNDSIFDQSYNRGTSLSFSLPATIKAWQIGVPLIGVGGKIQLFVPSRFGYGAVGSTAVPPYKVLIFDIELVDIYY